jgi:O-antigen ligase
LIASLFKVKESYLSERNIFVLWGLVIIISFSAAILTEIWAFAGLPAFILLVGLVIADFRKVFFLMLFCIPLSTELVLPNGFGTDLPTEPLMVGLMLVFLVFICFRPDALAAGFIRHPITLFILLHWGWTLIPLLTSADPFISLKFFLAKSWYVLTFFFLGGYLLRRVEDLRKFFWVIFLPMFGTVVYVLVRHAGYGFSFSDVYRVLSPFYRNHVSYAAIMAIFVPLVWFVRQWYPRKSFAYWFLWIAFLVLIVAIQLSYTRAAMGAAALSIIAWGIIRLQLVKATLVLVILVVGIALGWMSAGNTYLAFAPEFESTISHTRFDNLLEATAQGKDISTMERFYRWIAGFNMVNERPLTGFGPGNFLEQYKPYAVNSFRTYVSHNPERSGIHCYYLMIAVEQGLPGLFIFVLLTFVTLVLGEKLYHRLTVPIEKQAVMMLLLSFIAILILCVINDLIETDKVGSFFFMILAMLVNLDLSSRQKKKGSG